MIEFKRGLVLRAVKVGKDDEMSVEHRIIKAKAFYKMNLREEKDAVQES